MRFGSYESNHENQAVATPAKLNVNAINTAANTKTWALRQNSYLLNWWVDTLKLSFIEDNSQAKQQLKTSIIVKILSIKVEPETPLNEQF